MRAWLAIVVPLWLVLAICCAWEPVVHDSWGHLHLHAGNFDLDRWWWFVKGQYRHNNPRAGQAITVLLFSSDPWHVIVTPLVELGLVWLGTAHVLGRLPRRGDALAFLVVAGMTIASMPVIGQMLFYRPYSGNYLYPWVIDLALLLPYRLHLERARRWPVWLAVPMLVAGGLAGWGNEHTGATVIAVQLAAIAWFVRRGERPQPWMIAAVVGVAVGYYALLAAPAQDIRYNGLATHASTMELIASRGVAGNAAIFGWLALHAAAALPWLVVARGPAPRSAMPVVFLAAALLVTATLLASPKQGERLYLASTTLAAMAAASWVLPRLRTTRAQALAAGISIVVLAVASAFCLSTYAAAGPADAVRVERITHGAPGSVVRVPRLPAFSYWTIGEDLDDPVHRVVVAKDWGLRDIELE
jgi:hypothetical protein